MCTGDIAVFRTSRRTRQVTKLAQATWNQFIDACREDLHRDGLQFMVQVPFEQVDDDEALREHLWLQVVAVHEDTVEAKLAHRPRFVPGLEIGWTTMIAQDEVSNWTVHTEDGPIGPGDIDPQEATHERPQRRSGDPADRNQRVRRQLPGDRARGRGYSGVRVQSGPERVRRDRHVRKPPQHRGAGAPGGSRPGRAALESNRIDSVDIDWDAIDVGEPVEQIRKAAVRSSLMATLGMIVAVLALLSGLVFALASNLF